MAPDDILELGAVVVSGFIRSSSRNASLNTL
jgi:hypothetical protein